MSVQSSNPFSISRLTASSGILAARIELALDERTLEFVGDEAAMQALKRDSRRRAAPAA